MARSREPSRRRRPLLSPALLIALLAALAPAGAGAEQGASLDEGDAPAEPAADDGEGDDTEEDSGDDDDSALAEDVRETTEPDEDQAETEAEPGEDEAEPDDEECLARCEQDEARASYVLEDVEIQGNRRTRESVILRELEFEPGEVLDLDDPDIETSRYRLLATGFFTSVNLRLRRGSRRGAVVLVVEVVERWTLVVREVFLGVSEISPYGGLHLDEINLMGLGISLSGAFVASRDQQGYRVRLGVPRVAGAPLGLTVEFLYNSAHDYLGRSRVLVTGVDGLAPYAEVAYRRLGGSIGTGVRLGHNLDLRVQYRLEFIWADLPQAAAEIDPSLGGDIGDPIDFHLHNGRSVLSEVSLLLDYDTRDHPFLPTRGHRVAVETTVSTDIIGSHYHFFKLTLQADIYLRFRWRHSLHFRLLFGSIFGQAPLYELYFIGDLSDQVHARVLDLNFSHAPVPNVFRTSIEEMRYESLAGRIDIEYIVPLYRGRRVVYGFDFFLLLGVYAIGSAEDFQSPPAGYPGGAFPVDLTLDVGFRLDTTAGVFGFSFKNLLGLIPFSED